MLYVFSLLENESEIAKQKKKKTENIPQAAQAAALKSNSKSIQVCLKREAFFQLV